MSRPWMVFILKDVFRGSLLTVMMSGLVRIGEGDLSRTWHHQVRFVQKPAHRCNQNINCLYACKPSVFCPYFQSVPLLFPFYMQLCANSGYFNVKQSVWTNSAPFLFLLLLSKTRGHVAVEYPRCNSLQFLHNNVLEDFLQLRMRSEPALMPPQNAQRCWMRAHSRDWWDRVALKVFSGGEWRTFKCLAMMERSMRRPQDERVHALVPHGSGDVCL